MKTIVEFFDPHNLDHLRAHRTLQQTGQWPDGFVPEGTPIPELWQVSIIAKLGHAWIDEKLGENT